MAQAWTEVNDLNTARNEGSRGMGGTQTSALMVWRCSYFQHLQNLGMVLRWTERLQTINTGRKASMDCWNIKY